MGYGLHHWHQGLALLLQAKVKWLLTTCNTEAESCCGEVTSPPFTAKLMEWRAGGGDTDRPSFHQTYQLACNSGR
jgi:hypothetical protein